MERPRRLEAVVIGASAGAVDALSAILPALPSNFPAPVIIVVHIPPTRSDLLPELFQRKSALRVKEAEDKEPIEPGTVYFAPPDYHVLIEPDLRLSLSSEEPVLYSRPSIDVLFESAADVYGECLLGVVLTGASSDGANGLQAICEMGGTAVVQRPDSAYASAMPQAAADACPGAQVLELCEISAFLQHAAKAVAR